MSEQKEKCAVFGIYHPGAARLTAYGLNALQHRGQESCGIFSMSPGQTADEIKFFNRRANGLVNEVFSDDEINYLSQGSYAIGHNRYSTSGTKSVLGIQPIYRPTDLGGFAIAHNGNITNAEVGPYSTDTEWLAEKIQNNVNSKIMGWSEAIIDAAAQCEGAFSILVLTPIGMFALRDGHGYRPLVIGMLDGAYVFASETCALEIIGAEFIREAKPGELLWLHERMLLASMPEELKGKEKFCIFEKIYFSRPDSYMDGETLYSYRKRLGYALAEKERTPNLSVVLGVPDSGVPAAIGYAKWLDLDYSMGIVKNRYSGRTFISPTQEMRETKASLKYNIIREEVNNENVVLIDDSIVRGTTMRKLIKDIRAKGARSVHVRISSPPIRNACKFGIDTHDGELIAKHQDIEYIRDYIGADSLRFLSIDDIKRVAMTPNRGYCTECFSEGSET